MQSTILRGIAVAAAAFAAACGTADSLSPTSASMAARRTLAAAERGAVKQSVDQNIWVSCLNGGDGEAVHVTGDLRYDLRVAQDASGVSHLNIKSNTSGLTGLGLTSGTFFRASMTEHVNSRGEDLLNSDVRTTDIIRFTATGSREAYSLMVTSHFIVDDGNYVLWEQTWNEVCR